MSDNKNRTYDEYMAVYGRPVRIDGGNVTAPDDNEPRLYGVPTRLIVAEQEKLQGALPWWRKKLYPHLTLDERRVAFGNAAWEAWKEIRQADRYA